MNLNTRSFAWVGKPNKTKNTNKKKNKNKGKKERKKGRKEGRKGSVVFFPLYSKISSFSFRLKDPPSCCCCCCWILF